MAGFSSNRIGMPKHGARQQETVMAKRMLYLVNTMVPNIVPLANAKISEDRVYHDHPHSGTRTWRNLRDCQVVIRWGDKFGEWETLPGIYESETEALRVAVQYWTTERTRINSFLAEAATKLTRRTETHNRSKVVGMRLALSERAKKAWATRRQQAAKAPEAAAPKETGESHG
jgi:Arc/MetJ-type ribon-helix-helix transcriptional regulator